VQATLASKISFEGVGLHSGKESKVTLLPMGPNYGIWFKRTDTFGVNNMVQAIYSNVEDKPLCTRLINRDGVSVSTVEHIMAALTGCGIQNILIEVSSEEIPILDGCAEIFVETILEVGIIKQTGKQFALQILSKVEVVHNEASASLSPANSLEIDFSIDFEEKGIGKQFKSLNMANGTFVRELSNSRTFCQKNDIEKMHSRGLALGGSYDNAIVFDQGNILTPGGLRHDDEAVRHKMLDALGDLSLAGMPIIGRFVGVCAGHLVTHRLLNKLFSKPSTYKVVECSPNQLNTLPGFGVTHLDIQSEPNFS
jgi:UDP-3-O-[3-hydroxymyristoyl] N-acetylglucosamine deacetylase